jgi:hypothetical protein
MSYIAGRDLLNSKNRKLSAHGLIKRWLIHMNSGAIIFRIIHLSGLNHISVPIVSIQEMADEALRDVFGFK